MCYIYIYMYMYNTLASGEANEHANTGRYGY